MGNGISTSAADNTLEAPEGYIVPPFPSLYNPRHEFLKRLHDNSDPPPGTYYLYKSEDIFRFTLYWTFILYCPIFLIAGSYALLIHTFTKRHVSIFSLLTPVLYLVVSLFWASIGAAIIGYVLAAVYSVGLFSMSTWVPFLWALVLTLVTVMSSYSTIITIL
ncbi:hypothetical protein FRC02_003783 [Tulasnella sp. 418]|nr:hypothetical protein FRC02_003783 [Tulasnella sp. 418]